MTGGAGRSVHYQLIVAALPFRPPFQKRQRSRRCQNPDPSVTLSTAGTGTDNPDITVGQTPTLVTQRVTPLSQNPDTSVTRSVSDPSVKRQAKSHHAEKTAAAPPSPPRRSNTKVITRIAHSVMDTIGEDSPDLPESIKLRCAREHIPYDSEAVRKAIESACFQRRKRGPNDSGQ